jgi:hypothetical protein
MRRASVATLALWLGACGGGTVSSRTGPQLPTDASTEAGPDEDATTDDAGVYTGFLVVLHDEDGGCVPQVLPVNSAGDVPCTLFEVLPSGSCVASHGLSDVDPSAATKVRAQLQAPASDPVCQLAQTPPTTPGASCASAPTPGWCYVSGAAAGDCPQAIDFAPGAVAAGDVLALGCE